MRETQRETETQTEIETQRDREKEPESNLMLGPTKGQRGAPLKTGHVQSLKSEHSYMR